MKPSKQFKRTSPSETNISLRTENIGLDWLDSKNNAKQSLDGLAFKIKLRLHLAKYIRFNARTANCFYIRCILKAIGYYF